MPAIGTYEPDKFDLDGTTSRVVRNVYPKAGSYGPIPGPALFGDATLPAECRGLTPYRTASGAWGMIAGTATKLYLYESGAWTDVTRSTGGDYSVPDGDFWSFCQFGSQIIACNANDDPQVFDVDGSDTEFSALGGSPPKGRIVRAVQDFVWIVGSLTNPYTVYWSDLNDAEDWTPAASTGGQSDSQFFPSGGRVMTVTGGKTGFVFQEKGIQAFEYIGPGLIYRFQEVEGARGCISAYGVASVGSTSFYLGEDGFYSIDIGAGLKPIGATRVNTWWRENTDPARQASVMAIADPVAPRIIWAGYASSASTAFDVGLIYDWQLDQWAEFRGTAQVWAAMATPGMTLEDLDAYGSLEDIPASLDSPIWSGSKPTFGGVNASGGLFFMSGPNMEATVATPRFRAGGAQGRAFISEVWPITSGCDCVEGRIGAAERMQDDLTYTSFGALDRMGRFCTRSSGRVHEIELTFPAGADWQHVQGVDVTAKPDGMR